MYAYVCIRVTAKILRGFIRKYHTYYINICMYINIIYIEMGIFRTQTKLCKSGGHIRDENLTRRPLVVEPRAEPRVRFMRGTRRGGFTEGAGLFTTPTLAFRQLNVGMMSSGCATLIRHTSLTRVVAHEIGFWPWTSPECQAVGRDYVYTHTLIRPSIMYEYDAMLMR